MKTSSIRDGRAPSVFPKRQYAWYGTMLRVMGEEKGKTFMQALGRQELPVPRLAGFDHPIRRRRRIQFGLCL